jgi:pantoate--beta-alanine ligase
VYQSGIQALFWTKSDSIAEAIKLVQSRIQVASGSLERVDMKLDYVEMNDAATFEELRDSRTKSEEAGGQIILSGALWVSGTRMIDNILIGVNSK